MAGEQGRLLIVVHNDFTSNQKLLEEGNFTIHDTSDRSIINIIDRLATCAGENTNEDPQLTLF